MLEFSKVLDFLNKNYIPGMAAFYDKQNPNEFQAMHESVEAAYRTGDPLVFASTCDRVKLVAVELADKFRLARDAGEKTEITARDGFYIADPERLKRAYSIRNKRCYHCDAKDKRALKIRRFNGSPDDIYLSCDGCAA